MNSPLRPKAARTREHATLTPNIIGFTVHAVGARSQTAGAALNNDVSLDSADTCRLGGQGIQI